MTKEQLRVIMGENIRNERVARSMSIDELAELLELTSGFVGLIERGRRGATAHTLLKLSDIFDMPIDNIFTRSEGLSVAEEKQHPTKAKRDKIRSLIADLTDRELDFIIRVVKGIKAMNHTKHVYDEDEDESEYAEE